MINVIETLDKNYFKTDAPFGNCKLFEHMGYKMLKPDDGSKSLVVILVKHDDEGNITAFEVCE